MSGLTEPSIETLELLDFSPTCISRVCEQVAVFVVRTRCTRCRKLCAWPVCREHLTVAIQSITATRWTHGDKNESPDCPYIIELELAAVEPLS